MNAPDNSTSHVKHRPRKRFGQNFLRDEHVIERIVSAIAPAEGQTLIEIGPGQGALTHNILSRMPNCSSLIAIELDRDLLSALESLAVSDARLRLIGADVLQTDFLSLRREYDAGFNVCGNLPYNISSPLLIKLLEAQAAWYASSGEGHSSGTDVGAQVFAQNMTFMLQKEVVERITASPGSKSYGRLSVVLQTVFDAERLFDVSPQAFSPPPKVMSSVVRLSPKKEMLIAPEKLKQLQSLVALAFSQRRKTLKNNLKKVISIGEIELLGIDPACRPETLQLQEFVALADLLDNSDADQAARDV